MYKNTQILCIIHQWQHLLLMTVLLLIRREIKVRQAGKVGSAIIWKTRVKFNFFNT